jgi:hypothetical protein
MLDTRENEMRCCRKMASKRSKPQRDSKTAKKSKLTYNEKLKQQILKQQEDETKRKEEENKEKRDSITLCPFQRTFVNLTKGNLH